jgi:hypothetical protein
MTVYWAHPNWLCVGYPVWQGVMLARGTDDTKSDQNCKIMVERGSQGTRNRIEEALWIFDAIRRFVLPPWSARVSLKQLPAILMRGETRPWPFFMEKFMGFLWCWHVIFLSESVGLLSVTTYASQGELANLSWWVLSLFSLSCDGCVSR